MPAQPFVIAHAACKGHAPENTLAGIRAALDLGADGIEIDVHCTADDVPILLHDGTVDRTTDGQGEVTQMTLAQVKALDAGARQFEGRFAGERVPTLAEVLDLTRGRALLVLEVKQLYIEQQVLRVVRDLGAVNDCVVHSFIPHVVARFRVVEPSMPAAFAYCLRMSQKPWRVSRSPRRLTKRARSFLFFTSRPRPSFSRCFSRAASICWETAWIARPWRDRRRNSPSRAKEMSATATMTRPW